MKLNFTKPPNCVQSDCVELFFPSALRVSVDPSETGVLNFGKSSRYKMMYSYGVHLSGYVYLYWLLAFLLWNVVQAFQSFFFPVGLLALTDLLKLFIYSEA